MKIKVLLLGVLLLTIATFSLSIDKKEMVDIEFVNTSAIINQVHEKYNLPTTFVLNQSIPTYEYNGVVIPDFRKYFTITEGRNYILNMHSNPIFDLGGYTWDFRTFSVNTVGEYRITLRYTGADGSTVQSHLTVQVTDTDVEAPVITGLTQDHYNLEYRREVNGTVTIFERWMATIYATDTVDGNIPIDESFFSGHEQINTSLIGQTHTVTLTVSDSAGNTFTKTVTITIRDTTPPIIYNIANIETNKGKSVDYQSNVEVSDNYSQRENLTFSFSVVDQDGQETGKAEVDFDVLGEHFVKVIVTDEQGNHSNKIFRVIVKNPVSIGEVILYINGGGALVAGLAIGLKLLLTKKKTI